MICLLRAGARRHHHRHKRDVWRTFDGVEGNANFVSSFESLVALDENDLAAGGEILGHEHETTEIVTYVREGTIDYDDSSGHSGAIQAGEFHRMIVPQGAQHTEANASLAHRAHVFQIRLRPSDPDVAPAREQMRFSTAERRGVLRVVASPDLTGGAIRLVGDVRMYSAILEPGQHVVHELAPDRAAWLHVVVGEITLDDLVLTTGDGAGLTAERAVSLTARERTELLLVNAPSNRNRTAARPLQ